MDKLLAPTKDDLKIVFKREYRQRQEQIRKERIFNPRIRLIGVDKNALDQHVQEKQNKKLMNQQEEMCFAMELNRQIEAVNLQQSSIVDEQLRKQREINEFRTRFQQKEQAREFDLNDPCFLRKTSPCDGLKWLGVDPQHSHRIQLQREQQKSWIEQQINEKNETNKNMIEAEQAIEANALSQDAQFKEKEHIDSIQRLKTRFDTARFNRELAEAQKAKQKKDKRREEEDNLAEIMNNLSSDMLTGSKESGTCSSLFGGNRKSVTMYRGMTDEQLKEIRHQQFRQIEEKKLNSAMLKESDCRFDKTVMNRINRLEIEEENVRRMRQQSLSQQNAINAQLLNEQKERNRHMNSEVYKFKPTEAYFNQFNTTSR